MAEVKNTFIQSKMNQDLDGRILPNGQYRYGKNIQISRSEGDDVGALENVLGTKILTTFGLVHPAYEIIGHTVDLANDIIYVFITDYSDASNNQLNNNITGQNSAFGYTNKNCFIGFYNHATQASGLLVGGDFLNFSKTHPITGVNLVEDLLFWTDNRNQPRKINVNTATGQPFILGSAAGYYTNEDTISVAKYYPFECISLLDFVPGQQQWESSMTNKTDQWLPPFCAASVDNAASSLTSFTVYGDYTNIPFPPSGVEVLISGYTFQNNPTTGVSPKVTHVFPPFGSRTEIVVNQPLSVIAPDLATDDIVYFQFPNPDYDPIWPGDETFLSDKFVRFSYRFEFDDGEYSLMAPFTQACFIPKQDGYFIGNNVETTNPPMWDDTVPLSAISKTLIGDEGKAYASSIVEFFENKVQDVGLYIPAPYKNDTQSTFDNIQNEFKIKNIEIIYKESDSTTAYILDTIAADSGTQPFNLELSSYYKYDYQSRQPWKTLPGNEITRVYDKVPLRALAQESAGNRIIYGNYIDKHTSPDSLTYVVGIDPKGTIPTPGSIGFGQKDYYVRKEYQNHTVKQNRTYQVGVVLSDRYGRQSDVILSDVFNAAVNGYGSTIFHPYRNTQASTITTNPTPDTWPGDIINMIWHQGIPEAATANGYPGIYKNNNGTLVDLVFELGDWYGLQNSNPTSPCGYGFTVFQVSGATAQLSVQVNTAGQAIPGTVVIESSTGGWIEGGSVFIDMSSPILWPLCSIPAVSPPQGTYVLKAKTLVDQNTLGWYSWKVVVKQNEQDYYNCYLPGMLAGYPKDLKKNDDEFAAVSFPKGNEHNTAHIVLLNDNINKIPRDLSEVGPTQKIFGSSVKLYGRVENYKTTVNYYTYNRQFDPETLPDTVVNIGTISTMELGAKLQCGSDNVAAAPFSYPTDKSILMPINFFNGKANPLVAEISTKKEIGYRNHDGPTPGTSLGMIPYLSIYETEPIVSELDIYWETSSAGLISDLNYNILNVDNTVPCDISDPSITWCEDDPPGTAISGIFQALSCEGVELDHPVDDCTVQLLSVINANGIDRRTEFVLQKDAFFNRYWIEIDTDPGEGFFVAWNDDNARTWTFTFQVDRPAVTISPTLSTPAFSAQYTRTAQVQNQTPNQVGMFNPIPGNNARTAIKQAVFEMDFQYLNLNDEPSALNPDYVVVGGWQKSYPYNSDSDNAYWSTFGRNYDDARPCNYVFYPNGDMGYGINDVGQQDYFPTGDVQGTYNKPKDGYKYPPSPTISKNYNKYLGAQISMVKNPSFSGIAPWDGTFEAYNGAYGSLYGIPAANSNPNRGQELVFEVIRAYQVSAFYPLQVDVAQEDCGTGVGKDQSYAKWSIGEVVFSNDGTPSANPIPLVSTLPNMGGGKIQTRQAFPNNNLAGATYINSRPVPPGPVYWNFERQPQLANCQNIWPASGTALTDPKDFNTGGEPSVLNNYNVAGQLHYWKDLSDAVGSGHPISKIWTVDEFQPLLDSSGVPTVGSPCTSSTDKLSDYTQIPMRGFWYVSKLQVNSNDSPQEHHIQTSVELKQATWQDNYGKPGTFSSNNFNEDPCFVIENDAPPVLGSGDPQTAKLKTSSEYPVPPGRYVVTVRVTDRTLPDPRYDGYLGRQNPNHASGDGLYYEWDVPVIINGPFFQDLGSGQFTWQNTSPTGKPRNWNANPGPNFGFYNGYPAQAPWVTTTDVP